MLSVSVRRVRRVGVSVRTDSQTGPPLQDTKMHPCLSVSTRRGYEAAPWRGTGVNCVSARCAASACKMLLPLLLVWATRTAAQTTTSGCTCKEACTTEDYHREWCKTRRQCGTYSWWGYYWDTCADPGESTKGGCTCKSSFTTWAGKTYDGCTTDDHYASWCAVQSPCCPFFGTIGCWDECGTKGEPYAVLELPNWGEDDPCEEKLDTWWACMQEECGTTEASEMGDTIGGLLGEWGIGRGHFGRLCGLLCTFLGSCGCQQVLGQIGQEIGGMLGQLVFGGVSFLANCGDILADSKAANAKADSIQGKSCAQIEASNGFANECVNLPYNGDICVAKYRRYIECKYEDQAERQNMLKDCQLTCPTEIINAAGTNSVSVAAAVLASALFFLVL